MAISGGPFLGFTGTTVEMVPAGAGAEEIVPLLLWIMGRKSFVRIRVADLELNG